MHVNAALACAYDFFDADGDVENPDGARFAWSYRDETQQRWLPIAGATGRTFVLPHTMQGMQTLSCRVDAVATRTGLPNTGTPPTPDAWSGNRMGAVQGAPTTVSDMRIVADEFKVGRTVQVSYIVHDADGDDEDRSPTGSQFQWHISDPVTGERKPIAGATGRSYVLQPGDVGERQLGVEIKWIKTTTGVPGITYPPASPPGAWQAVRDVFVHSDARPDRTWSNDHDMPITEGGQGIESTIVVPESGTIQELRVELGISHSDRRYLLVELFSPWGERFVLHNRTNDSLNRMIDIPQAAGKSQLGTWRLRIYSDPSQDSAHGALQSWRLHFADLPHLRTFDDTYVIKAWRRDATGTFRPEDCLSIDDAAQATSPLLRTWTPNHRLCGTDHDDSVAHWEVRSVRGSNGLLLHTIRNARNGRCLARESATATAPTFYMFSILLPHKKYCGHGTADALIAEGKAVWDLSALESGMRDGLATWRGPLRIRQASGRPGMIIGANRTAAFDTTTTDLPWHFELIEREAPRWNSAQTALAANGAWTESRLDIDDQGFVSKLHLEIDSTVNTQGQLQAWLIGPDGTEYFIKARSNMPGQLTRELRTYRVEAATGKSRFGTWTLRLRNFGATAGTLHGWSLHFAGIDDYHVRTPDPELTNGRYVITGWHATTGTKQQKGCMMWIQGLAVNLWTFGGGATKECGIDATYTQPVFDIARIKDSRGRSGHTIRLKADGRCLIRSNNGTANAPTPHLWGGGNNAFCGFPNAESLLDNGQAIWNLDTFAIDNYFGKTMHRGQLGMPAYPGISVGFPPQAGATCDGTANCPAIYMTGASAAQWEVGLHRMVQ